MRHTPSYLMTDPAEVKHLIRQHPWATFVSSTARGLVASHYPVLLEESADGIVLLSHFGKPDDELHELGRHEMLVIIQGPHDYISSSWYGGEGLIPTWNHLSAHLHGTPQLLSEQENYAMLARLTDHFEQHHTPGRSLGEDVAGTRQAAKGTVGLRLPVTRFEARAKLSQDKDPAVVQQVIAHLQGSNQALAQHMRRAQEHPGSHGAATPN